MSALAVGTLPPMISGVTFVDADEIARRRHGLGWSMNRLAAESKLSERTILSAEHGEKVSERSLHRIVAALEEGEREQLAESEPDLATVHYIVDTAKGPVRVVATVRRDMVGRLDLPAAVERIVNDPE